jgi:hypothetical protein
MKIVREHINEKFSEKGDPIHDMEIGAKQQLKSFVLDTVLNAIRKKTYIEIENIFEENMKNLYFLGDDEYTHDKKHIKRLINLIKKGKLLKTKTITYTDDSDDGSESIDTLRLYQTSVGRILTMEEVSDDLPGPSPLKYNTSEVFQFAGDLEAAINLNIIGKETEIIF